jgi:hypothetical protein
MKLKPKAILALLISTLAVNFLTAQGHWQWATNFGGAQPEDGVGLTITPQGNLLCTGFLTNESSFMADTFIVATHSPQNAFVCKYDNAGNLLHIATGTGTPNYIGTDDGVSIYPLTHLPGSPSYLSVLTASKTATVDTTHLNGGDFTIYLSKWDTNVHLTGVKPLALYNHPGGVPGISTLNYCYGSIYTTGGYGGVYADLDTIRLYNPDSAVLTSSKGFFAKMDTAGKFKLAKPVLGSKRTELLIYNTFNNKLLCYGEADSCFQFDTINLCAPFGHGIAVFFLTDTNGHVLWSRPFHSESNIYGISTMAMDNSTGDIYLAGSFDSVAYIGLDTFYNQHPGYYGKFIAKINISGNLMWFRQIYRTGLHQLHLPKSVLSDKFYVAGSFSGSMALCADTITAESSRDMFVARFDTSGNCIGMVTVPNAIPAQFEEDSAGNVYVTGSILDNGAAAFDETTLSSSGNSDFFLAKLSAITSGAPRLQQNNLLTIYPNPNTSSFTVQVPEGLNGKRIQLGVYNNNGQTIKEERLAVEDNKLAVALGEITKGIYTVILSSGQKKYTGRVVVK